MRSRSLALALVSVFYGCGGGESGQSAPPVQNGQPIQPKPPPTTGVQHTLTVDVSGAGTVMSAPAGIDCPGACSASFAEGTTITLSATQGVTWGGACSGSSACSVTPIADASVSAAFPAAPADDCEGIVPAALPASVTRTIDTNGGGSCGPMTSDEQGNVAGYSAGASQWTTWLPNGLAIGHIQSASIAPQGFGFQGVGQWGSVTDDKAFYTWDPRGTSYIAEQELGSPFSGAPGTFATYPASTWGSVLLTSACNGSQGTVLVSRYGDDGFMASSTDLLIGGCSASAAVSDELRHTLVVVLSQGRVLARWLDEQGAFLTPWIDAGAAPANWAPVLQPLIGGGAALRSGGTWLASFHSGAATVLPPPAFARDGYDLRTVRGSKAYALIPLVDASSFGIVSPSGKSCGALPVLGDGALSVGRDGTVFALNGCDLTWWPQLLGGPALTHGYPPPATPPPAPAPSGPGCFAASPADPGWQWESPAPQGQNLDAAITFSAKDVWAVGAHGALVHWNGTAWTASRIPTNAAILSVWGANPADVWAGTDDGAIFHCDGQAWSKAAVAQGPLLATILTGSASNDVWALGNGFLSGQGITIAQLMHWDGVSWTQPPFPEDATQLDRRALWQSSRNDLWVGGCGAVGGTFESLLYHWDGKAWTQTTSGDPGCVTSVAGASPNDVWATIEERFRCDGDDGAWGFSICTKNDVAHWDGTAWTASGGPAPGFSTLLSEPVPGEVWAQTQTNAGTDVYRWDGAAWSFVRSFALSSIADSVVTRVISGVSANDLWFFGAAGLTEHWDGHAASSMGSSLPAITSMWGASDDDLWALGISSVSHRTAAGWTTTDLSAFLAQDVGLYAIWGSGSNDVWIAGTGLFLHWNGAAWSRVPAPYQFTPETLWGSGPDDVYVGGSEGLFHFDGNNWSHVLGGDPDFAPTEAARAVWGTAAADVWAVTLYDTRESSFSKLYHFDGQTWTLSNQLWISFNGPVTTLSGTSPSDVWATGEGRMLHWDGIAWQIHGGGLPSFDMYNAASTQARAPDDVWTNGDSWPFHTARHFDGVRWSEVATPAGDHFYLVPGGSLWSFGEGALVRHQ